VVGKLIEASKAIDELYWRQVSRQSRVARAVEKRAPGVDYFCQQGPVDRLKEKSRSSGDEEPPARPSIRGHHKRSSKIRGGAPRSEGADRGLFTVVAATAPTSRPFPTPVLSAVPGAGGERRSRGAALTTNASLKRFLTTRADAFFSNDYRESDLAWMDLDSPIEVSYRTVRGLTRNLFNYKRL